MSFLGVRKESFGPVRDMIGTRRFVEKMEGKDRFVLYTECYVKFTIYNLYFWITIFSSNDLQGSISQTSSN